MPQYCLRQHSSTSNSHSSFMSLVYFSGMAAYSGRMTRTSWPRSLSTGESAPTTSARPPVLMNGTHSEAANRIFMWGYLLRAK